MIIIGTVVMTGPAILLFAVRIVGGRAAVTWFWLRVLRWIFFIASGVVTALLTLGQIVGLQGDEGPAWFAVLMLGLLIVSAGLIAWFFAEILGEEGQDDARRAA